MKLGKIALAISALMFGATAFAGTITGSSNITFLAFDGQKVRKNTNFQVNDTKPHQVVVEVSSIYQTGSDSAFFESQPIILTFEGSSEDIKITAPNLRSDIDVTKFKKSPSFKIETVSGKTLPYKQDYLKGEGFVPNSRVESNLAKYNAGKGVAAVPAFANAVLEAKGQMVVETKNIKEEQLQLLFSKADKETQKRFLEWAKQNAK